MSNLKLINYAHDKKNNIRLRFYNDETKKIEIKETKYDNYFFIDAKNLELTKNVLRNIYFKSKWDESLYTLEFNFIQEDKYIKIGYTTNPLTTPIFECQNIIREILDKNNITHYELDLMPGDNYLLNNNFEISSNYRILYLDIETRDDTGDIEIGRDRILSICAIDNEGKEFILCEDSEKDLLEKYSQLINNYDLLVGWNSSKFDFPYIRARLKEFNIPYYSKLITEIDLMKVFMDSFAVKTRIGKKFITSYSLENICRSFLNTGKIKIEDSDEGYGGRLWKLFNTNRDKLIKYNLQDARLLKLLDEEFNLINNEILLAQLVKTPLSKTRSLISMIDYLFIREARKRNSHLKSKPKNVDKAQYEGGFVYECEPGLYEKINIFDFASLYPSIFRTFNISPDTLLEKEEDSCVKLPNGKYFTQKFRGLIPSVLDELTELRLKLKKEQQELKSKGLDEEVIKMDFKQTAVKVLILAIYGTSGSVFFRGFNLDVASSVTLTGQHLLKSVINTLNTNGFKVVGGDTDSLFTQIINDKDRPKVEELIKNTIEITVRNTGVTGTNYLRMEHEKILSKFIVLAKKKYAGLCIYDNKPTNYIYNKGLELVQASQLKLTKELLNTILEMILIKDSSTEEIHKTIKEYRNKVLRKKIDNVNDITIIKKVGKMPEGYKNLPAHVSLALERKKNGELFYTSQKVPFIVLSNNPLKILHINDFNGDYDAKYYWLNQIYPPTYRLLNVVYPLENWEFYNNGDIAQKNITEYF